MRILVACEESQAVTIELRKLGHEAYSCDIIECSGGHLSGTHREMFYLCLTEAETRRSIFAPRTIKATSCPNDGI